MLREMLFKWTDEYEAKKNEKLSFSQRMALIDFVDWLDAQRSPTTRAPAEAGGARCQHCGYWDVDKLGVCNNCGEVTPRPGG